MKPLLSRPITKESKAGHGDWISAADHSTVDGFKAFERRQEERKRRMQGKSAETVTQLRSKP